MADKSDAALIAGESPNGIDRACVPRSRALLELRAYAFERLNAAAVLLNGHGDIVDTNETWRLFAHLNDGEASATGLGVNYLEVCDRAAARGSGSAAVGAGLRSILAGESTHFDFEYSCDSPTEERWFRLQASSVPVSDGSGLVLFHVDITAIKLRELQFEQQAERDSLTGLPNRAGAHRHLAALLADRETATVMFIDLNEFKLVNDTYGHHTGDELLTKVSTRLRGAVRSNDMVCRLGGDEFVVICSDLQPDRAESIRARIGEVLAPPFQVGVNTIRVGASVGCATSAPGSSVASLLRSADAEMYVAKGRSRLGYGLGSTRPTPASERVGDRGCTPVADAVRSVKPGLLGTELPLALPALAAALGVGLIITDDDGHIESWNSVAADLYGWDATEAIGDRLDRLIGFSFDDCFTRGADPTTTEPWTGDVRCRRKHGAPVAVRMVAIVAFSAEEGGRHGGVLLARRLHPPAATVGPVPPVDISPTVPTREQFTDARLSAIVDRSTDVAIFFERDGTIAWVSPASNEVLGFKPAELVGRCGFDLIHPDDFERVITELPHGLTHRPGPVRVEFRLAESSGRVRWIVAVVTDLTGHPDVGFVVGNLRDVTERKLSEEAVTRLALVDDLTGLPNRNALMKAIAEFEVTPDSPRDAGLILFDLDEFCDVNDTLGHEVGDGLLMAVAQRVRDVVPSELVVARFDSDQFAVFGPALSCPRTCRLTVATLRSGLAVAFQIAGHELIASATMGIADSSAGPVGELIRNADTALYHAKKTDRGGATFFRPQIADEAARRLRRTGELRRAVSGGEIVAHYQPVIELTSGRVLAVEALARWNHPEHGWVPPEEFVLLAETIGLIGNLGQQILEQSCAHAAEWLRQGRRIQLAVNASAAQLANPSFVETIDAALRATGLPPNQLTVEITETAAVSDPETALAVLTALKERGVVLSLDDFGTGYSPLTALRDLPITAIKLDRTFVAGLGSERGDNLAAGVIQLALAVGVHVVAEGVETQEQADRLREMGCRWGQGYLWSPAVPGSDVLATIARMERAGEQEPGPTTSSQQAC